MALSKITNASVADTAVHGRRRLNINGSMLVAQRGTSFTGKTSSSYGIDRHETKISTAGTWTLSQSSTAPEGFDNSFKVDCTTANSSLSASSNMLIQQRLEGQDLAHLKKGTSNAEKVTMSFWVRSSKTGTYVLEILDNDNDRHISKTYSISTADTWEHKAITFDGDTSGALTHDNSTSLEYNFWLVAGSNYTSGTLATSWASTTTANRAVGQVNLADSTSNEFYLTGVQLEIGDTVSPFEHRSFGEELALCQRYFERLVNSPTDCFATCAVWTDTSAYGVVNFLPKRADPTFTVSSGSHFKVRGANEDHATTALAGTDIRHEGYMRVNITTSGRTAGHAIWLRADHEDATVDLDAEL